MINAIELAKKLLNNIEFDEMNSLIELITKKNYKKFYEKYQFIVNGILNLISYDEFLDFINESITLNTSVLIFEFLCSKQKCLCVGGYEEQLQRKIESFSNLKFYIKDFSLADKLTDINVFTDFDGIDNFRQYISDLNIMVEPLNLKFVVFFNDLYSGCTYHLFILDKDFVQVLISEWNDDIISFY